MGDTRTVETFTPDRPEGYYGARTPWEDAPYLSPAQELASDALTRLTALNRDDPEQMSDSRLAVLTSTVVDSVDGSLAADAEMGSV